MTYTDYSKAGKGCVISVCYTGSSVNDTDFAWTFLYMKVTCNDLWGGWGGTVTSPSDNHNAKTDMVNKEWLLLSNSVTQRGFVKLAQRCD